MDFLFGQHNSWNRGNICKPMLTRAAFISFLFIHLPGNMYIGNVVVPNLRYPITSSPCILGHVKPDIE